VHAKCKTNENCMSCTTKNKEMRYSSHLAPDENIFLSRTFRIRRETLQNSQQRPKSKMLLEAPHLLHIGIHRAHHGHSYATASFRVPFSVTTSGSNDASLFGVKVCFEVAVVTMHSLLHIDADLHTRQKQPVSMRPHPLDRIEAVAGQYEQRQRQSWRRPRATGLRRHAQQCSH
jgi:hypothetical protein